MNLKVVIADDDGPSKSLLVHYIELLPEFEVIGEAANGDELIQLVKLGRPQIVLVDINMPSVNGVDAAKASKAFDPSLQVIFTTGYEEFAVEAFNMAAVDYIVKPIAKVRLFSALEKAKVALQVQKRIAAKQRTQLLTKLAIKSNLTVVYVHIDDILYVEKEGRKSIIYLEQEGIETMDSLQEIEKRLPPYFYRTHRSFVVNLRKIVKIESFGETYLANFAHSTRKAHISKLQIYRVYQLMGKS